MRDIIVLDSETIDKIAAGEVVERPVNVVKELLENAIDSTADIISVEIKNGGTDLIRVTDNGIGIESEQVKTAFLRHATSKLTTIKDLESLNSLGFRGEALSSISAVSKCEMITKTEDTLLGTHIVIEGSKLNVFENIGAPKGTTVISRQLFYNTPARKKFLKSPQAEAAAVEELVTRIALSHPDISISLIVNGKSRFTTNGNGNLKDAIYKLYDKEVYERLLKADLNTNGINVTGYIARPEYNMGTRECEIFFVNKRLVSSRDLSYAIEDGFKGFLMQHRFPFGILFIDIDPSLIDVNVHPKKSEVKFSDNLIVKNAITEAVKNALKEPELIPVVELDYKSQSDYVPVMSNEIIAADPGETGHNYDAFDRKPTENSDFSDRIGQKSDVLAKDDTNDATISSHIEPFEVSLTDVVKTDVPLNITPDIPKYKQENLFEDRLIDDKPLKEYRIIGQVFDTYWLITLNDDLYIMDQHAAHEKINYEHFLKAYEEKYKALTQFIDPPMLIGLSNLEEQSLKDNLAIFEKIGFEIDEFGDKSIAIRGVPMELFSNTEEEMFKRLLFEIHEYESVKNPRLVLEKLASMSCKAAIKGNQRVSEAEIKHIMEELMTLDNPYNCPHGRPTLICITKTELEKKFKRIV
jgi:DNA mismatch repair protein MutL